VKPTTLLATVLIVAGLVATWRPVAPIPEPIPQPPEAATQAIVAPVSAKLAGHADEAQQLAAFYHTAAETIRRDGNGAKVVKTTADLRTFCQRAVTLRFQGAFAKVSGLSRAIHGPDGALAKLLKLDVTELDHAKAAAALDAVAWACQEAAQ